MAAFLTYGEILGRLEAQSYQRLSEAAGFDLFVGGAEANVAVALAQWGHEAAIISAIPENALGQRVIKSLRSFGVSTSKIQFSGDKLGLYFLENGVGSKAAEVIYDRAQSVFSFWSCSDSPVRDFRSGVFHWSGITPAVSETACDNLRAMIRHLGSTDVTITADLNYRSKLWRWGKSPEQVCPELVRQSHVVIATEEAVIKMLGMKLSSAPEEITPTYYADMAGDLFEAYPNIQLVFIPVRRTKSARHNIISLFGQKQGGKMSQSETIELTDILDRVGAGDAMSAGIIHGLAHNWEMEKTLNFGVCASALKHSIRGDFLIASEDEVDHLSGGNKAKINR